MSERERKSEQYHPRTRPLTHPLLSQLQVNKHVDARAAGSRDLDSVQKAKQALDKRMADLEAQARKDQDTINDLRKQVAKLQSEKDANDAAAQQRISFLEGQGKKDTDEIAYLKRQVCYGSLSTTQSYF